MLHHDGPTFRRCDPRPRRADDFARNERLVKNHPDELGLVRKNGKRQQGGRLWRTIDVFEVFLLWVMVIEEVLDKLDVA